MIYLAELYYLQDQRDFLCREAVWVTAQAVSRWCEYYHARLLAPVSKDLKPVEQSGSLPNTLHAKEAFVRDLVEWIFEHSQIDVLFALFLDPDPLPLRDKVAQFDHHDDTCCWYLNLTEGQFRELQEMWKTHDLPEDLFYPEGHEVRVPYQGTGLKAYVLRKLGVQQSYTPKQWQIRQIS